MPKTDSYRENPMEPRDYSGNRNTEILAPSPFGIGDILWASKVGRNLYRIERQPIYGVNLFLNDIVRVTGSKAGPYLKISSLAKASEYFALVLVGLRQNAHGKKVFNELSKLGVCDPIEDDVFTMSAPRQKWPEIERILAASGIKTMPIGKATFDALELTRATMKN